MQCPTLQPYRHPWHRHWQWQCCTPVLYDYSDCTAETVRWVSLVVLCEWVSAHSVNNSWFGQCFACRQQTSGVCRVCRDHSRQDGEAQALYVMVTASGLWIRWAALSLCMCWVQALCWVISVVTVRRVSAMSAEPLDLNSHSLITGNDRSHKLIDNCNQIDKQLALNSDYVNEMLSTSSGSSDSNDDKCQSQPMTSDDQPIQPMKTLSSPQESGLTADDNKTDRIKECIQQTVRYWAMSSICLPIV